MTTGTKIEETLVSARTRLLRNLDEGTNCPCCGQWAQRYKRNMQASIAVPLILIHRAARRSSDGYIDVRPLAMRGGDYAKALWWGLIAKHPTQQSHFRVTEEGERFITMATSVPKYVVVYNNEVVGKSNQRIDIKTALGKKFDYAKLMRGDA